MKAGIENWINFDVGAPTDPVFAHTEAPNHKIAIDHRDAPKVVELVQS